MKKVILTSAAVLAICFAASAQTETPPPANTEATPPPTNPDSTTTPVDGAATNTEVAPPALDSLGNPIISEPAAPAAPPEKPTSRLKLYSGKHRGNNVIYNPK